MSSEYVQGLERNKDFLTDVIGPDKNMRTEKRGLLH